MKTTVVPDRRISCCIPKTKTPTQNMRCLTFFHYNNGYSKAPKCYVIRILFVFLKICVYARRFVQCCWAHFVIKLFILWSWQRLFYVYSYVIYLQLIYMYVIENYTVYNKRMYVCASQNWSPCRRCFHNLAMGYGRQVVTVPDVLRNWEGLINSVPYAELQTLRKLKFKKR